MLPRVYLMRTSRQQRCLVLNNGETLMINAATLMINAEMLKGHWDGPKERPLDRANARLPFTFLLPFSFTF